MTRARRTALLVAVLATAATAACGDPGTTDEVAAAAGTPGPSGDAEESVNGEIIVSAAASLTDAFADVGEAFEAENPGATVTFTFGPSSGLATQIVEGAPADVAAFANESTMQTVVAAGAAAGEPAVFATNDLVVVTKPGNPEGITGLADLTDVGVIALCGADVPCGSFAQEVLDNAGVVVPESSVTRGEDVRATLTAVSQGDAVAAIVYRTDAAAAGDAVGTVEIPPDVNVLATYPIVALAESGNAATAEAFVRFVLSPGVQALLSEYGFAPPSS